MSANITDVIAAVSTPPGKGGVAIIRMSGDGAFDVAQRVFRPMSGKPFGELTARTQYYGYAVDGNEKIDDVLLTRFPAPNSYTGEDVVEISCHGGILITRTVLETLFRHGARPAEAGEFTRRAFVGGKLSLTDAEAIGTLLEAGSREQLRLSSEPSRKRLTERVARIRSELVSIMSSVYARIDYPDEDLGDYSDDELLTALRSIRDSIANLASTYRTGRAITEGISTVICGKTNVGKSSLYNMLVGEDAAIVTEIEGTTRDILERTVPLGKVMLRLADTAGIRAGNNIDAVEQIGIERSRKMMEKCELLFAIFDNSREFDEYDAQIISEIEKLNCTKIAILNKSDMPSEFSIDKLGESFSAVIRISTVNGEDDAISQLAGIVDSLFTDGDIKIGSDAIIASARQHAEIMRALDSIELAIEGLTLGYPQDAVSGDITRAIGAISALDGREVGEEIVADIFSKFCVGK